MLLWENIDFKSQRSQHTMQKRASFNRAAHDYAGIRIPENNVASKHFSDSVSPSTNNMQMCRICDVSGFFLAHVIGEVSWVVLWKLNERCVGFCNVVWCACALCMHLICKITVFRQGAQRQQGVCHPGHTRFTKSKSC